MAQRKIETKIASKRVKPRYIVINENIHEALDLHSLALYMAFRYEADYEQEDSVIKRSSKFLYDKAKISRAQFFRCLNILEDYGLIQRDSSSQLNSISIYHVAQELNYFNTDCGVVSDRDGVVSDRDTDHYSLPSNINITNSDLSEKPQEVNKEILDAYHEILPDCPKIKVLDFQFKRQLNKMRKDWPNYQKDGESFTIESFRGYLNLIKTHYSWLIKPYTNANGNVRRNSLRNLTKEINLSKVVNGEFNAN
jgi:hypothetical protein